MKTKIKSSFPNYKENIEKNEEVFSKLPIKHRKKTFFYKLRSSFTSYTQTHQKKNDNKAISYLAGSKFRQTVLLSLREDTRMQHWGVSSLGAVLAAQHLERQLGVVHHGRNHQLGRTEPAPMIPGSINSRPSVHRPRWIFSRHRRRRLLQEKETVDGGTKAVVRAFLGLGMTGRRL